MNPLSSVSREVHNHAGPQWGLKIKEEFQINKGPFKVVAEACKKEK